MAQFRVIWVVAFGLFVFSILPTQAQNIPPADHQIWDEYHNARFGVRSDVPLIGFMAHPESANGDGKNILSETRQITISVFGSRWNIMSNSFADYRAQQRQMLLEQGAEITYAPGGRTWFVFSGYLGDQIFYFKSITRQGCAAAGHIYFLFPTHEKSVMSPIIEHMEDSFSLGISDGCPN